MSRYTYLGKGKVYLSPFAGGRRRRVGNCTLLDLAIAESVKELKDYQSPGGGTYASVRRVDKITIKMNVDDLNLDNLAMALYGSQASANAGTATDESHSAYLDGLVRLAQPPDAITSVTDATATTTYTAGDDYSPAAGGIIIPAGSAIPDGSQILVTYTYKSSSAIQALTQSGQEVVLYLEGMNEAENGAMNLTDIYRVKFGPLKNLGLLGDDFSKIELEGDVLKDESRPSGSQYFTITRPGA